MTPRQALASLLAVPYWAAVWLLGTIGGRATAVAAGLHGWVETAVGCGVALAIGTAGLVTQRPLLSRAAGWAWARVEILAAAWRELSGTTGERR